MTFSGRTLIGICVAAIAALTFTGVAAAAEAPPRIYFNGKEANMNRLPAIGFGQLRVRTAVLGNVRCLNTVYGETWNQHEGLETGKPLRGYGELLGFGSTSCEAPEEIAALEHICNAEVEFRECFERPITVTVTSEMPLELTRRAGEVCIEKTKTLEECSARNAEGMYTERETKQLIEAFHRRPSSLPWKAELVRGERNEEEGALLRLGLHEFGEAGTAQLHSTKCYPREGEKPASFKALPTGCMALNIVFPQVPAEFVYYGGQEIWTVNGVKSGLFPSHLEFIEAGTLVSTEGLEGEGTLTGRLNLDGASGEELLTAR